MLCAYLRDLFPVVDLSPVSAALHRAMGELGAILREHTAREDSGLDVDALVRRMSNSLRKLTGAAARLRGSGVAIEADVDEAFRMLTLKLEVLRWLAGDVESVRPLLPREELVGRAEQQRDLRAREIRRRYGGLREKSSLMALGLRLKEKLVRRELWAMGLVPQDGLWDVPTEEQWERGQEERGRLLV